MNVYRYWHVSDDHKKCFGKFKTKRAAVAALVRAGTGEVWTSDGCHLVAWLVGGAVRTREDWAWEQSK